MIAVRRTIRDLDRLIGDMVRSGKLPALSDLLLLPAATGKPVFPGLLQKPRQKSDIASHNRNIETFVEDASLLYEEIIEQQDTISMDTDATAMEFRKLLRDIRDLKVKLTEIVLANDFAKGIGSFAFDDFGNLEKVDTTRSTVDVDTLSTTVFLPFSRVVEHDFSYLSTVTEAEVQVTDVLNHTVSQESGTKFSNLFDSSTSAWIYTVGASPDARQVTSSFIVPLGNPKSLAVDTRRGAEFNRVVLSYMGSTSDLVRFSYKNPSSDGYRDLPIATILRVGGVIVLDVDLQRVEGWVDTPAPERYLVSHISDLKVSVTRTVPDRVSGDKAFYSFGFSDLSLFRKEHTNRGRLTSRSVPLIGPEGVTLYKATLSAHHTLPPGTAAAYYIGEDRYLAASFVDSLGGMVPPGSPDAVAVSLGTSATPEASGIRQTELRDWAISQGGYTYPPENRNYATWEPDWVPIANVEDGSVGSSTAPAVATFGNAHRVVNQTEVPWSDPSGYREHSFGAIDFYRVIDFYDTVVPGSVELKQGKDCWVKTVEEGFLVRSTTITGPLDGDEVEPTYTAPGNILTGSVRDVRSPTGPVEKYYSGEGPSPDYFVTYLGNKVIIKRNVGSASDLVNLQEDDIVFRVDYQEDTTFISWRTYFLLEEGQKGGLTINMGGVEEAKVLQRDRVSGIVIGELVVGKDGLVDFHMIGDGMGWFEVRIKVRAEWNPISYVTVTGQVQQYAWLNSLKMVSEYELLQKTKSEDHTKTAVFYPDSLLHYETPQGRSTVWLGVNDPTVPTSGDFRIELWHRFIRPGFVLTAADIFKNPETVSKFYSVSYTSIGRITDHILVRADLSTSDRNVTPILDGYAVRVVSI